MRIGLRTLTAVSALIAVVAVFWAAAVPGQGQAPAAGRTEDGKPNLNGIWQTFTTANWDIEAHHADAGPRSDIMGAWGAQPGGMGIVEGGTIPYKPEALKVKQEKFKNRMNVKVTNDPHRFDTGDPGAPVLPAGRAARELHAVSVSDFSEPGTDPDGVRIQRRHAHDLHGQASGGAGRLLDGMVERPLGRGYAGG